MIISRYSKIVLLQRGIYTFLEAVCAKLVAMNGRLHTFLGRSYEEASSNFGKWVFLRLGTMSFHFSNFIFKSAVFFHKRKLILLYGEEYTLATNKAFFDLADSLGSFGFITCIKHSFRKRKGIS